MNQTPTSSHVTTITLVRTLEISAIGFILLNYLITFFINVHQVISYSDAEEIYVNTAKWSLLKIISLHFNENNPVGTKVIAIVISVILLTTLILWVCYLLTKIFKKETVALKKCSIIFIFISTFAIFFIIFIFNQFCSYNVLDYEGYFALFSKGFMVINFACLLILYITYNLSKHDPMISISNIRATIYTLLSGLICIILCIYIFAPDIVYIPLLSSETWIIKIYYVVDGLRYGSYYFTVIVSLVTLALCILCIVLWVQLMRNNFTIQHDYKNYVKIGILTCIFIVMFYINLYLFNMMYYEETTQSLTSPNSFNTANTVILIITVAAAVISKYCFDNINIKKKNTQKPVPIPSGNDDLTKEVVMLTSTKTVPDMSGINSSDKEFDKVFSELSEDFKIRSETLELKKKYDEMSTQSDDLLLDIGRQFFLRYKGEDIEAETLGRLCESIDKLNHKKEDILTELKESTMIQVDNENNEKKCPACGQNHTKEASFCTKCGNILIDVSSQKNICSCGKENIPEAKFCTKCGQSLT